MPAYVEGRQLIAPQAVALVTEQPTVGQQPATGITVAVIATADGGTPGVFTELYNFASARATFRSGQLVDLLRRVYGPAQSANGAYKVLAYRVNAAVAATATIKDSTPATVISLTAQDYGLHTNQIRTKVEAATTLGYKVSTQGFDGTATIVRDNINRPLLSIDYTGTGTAAACTISSSQIAITITTTTADSITLSFANYPTVQSIADALTGTGVYAVTVLAPGSTASTTFDEVTATSVLNATTLYANVQAVVDYYNTAEPYITATRVSGKAIAVSSAYTNLTGGTNGAAVISSDYQTALTALQAEDCQIVIVGSEDSSVHAMVDAHCHLMSQTGANKERICILGGAAGETVAQGVTRAQALTSYRAALVYPGIKDPDDLGVVQSYSPAYTAAAVAGMMAGLPIGTPGTRKPIRCVDPVKRLTPSEIDTLLLGGVLPIEAHPDEGGRIVQSILSYNPTSITVTLLRHEISSRLAADAVIRRVRTRLEELIGQAGGNILTQRAESIADTALKECEADGLIVASDTVPAYSDLTATRSGDVITVSFAAAITTPGNYVVLKASLSSYA